MGGSHLGFERAEGMFDRAASRAHQVWITFHPCGGFIDEMFILPAGDPAFLARCAAGFQEASLAFIPPIPSVHQTAFFASVAICELPASRANVDAGLDVTGEVSLHKHALLAVARGFRSRNNCCDPGLVTGQNL